jgi:predicted DNA-binding transcriptional regulator AlpA
MAVEPEIVLAPVDPIEQLIDVKEVARRLYVSEDTVWVMAKDGRFIPPLHVGKLARWRVAEFNRYIEARAATVKAIEAAASRATAKSRKRRA